MPSTATMTKPVLPPLQTPKSASFPSEISTPMSAHPLSAYMKSEQDMKTPITPPTAYTDFLKALTPILASPPPSALGRSISDDSVITSKSATSSHSSKSSFSSLHGGEKHLSPTSYSLPPPTPLSASSVGPRSASSNLKRLRIPQQSPIFTPNSARSPYPYTASSTGSMIYSALSPADWTGHSNFDYITTPRSAISKPVSVRSVVTRTVTYKRTTPALDPAPKGKRRKTASAASSVVSEEDNKEVKQEQKLVKIEETEAETKPEDATQKMLPPPTIAVSPASNSTSMGDSDSSSISSSSTESP